MSFIAVEVKRGVREETLGDNLRQLVLDIHKRCDADFDPETDEARVLNAKKESIYTFHTLEILDVEHNGEFWCPTCQAIEVYDFDDKECPICESRMERLSPNGSNTF